MHGYLYILASQHNFPPLQKGRVVYFSVCPGGQKCELLRGWGKMITSLSKKKEKGRKKGKEEKGEEKKEKGKKGKEKKEKRERKRRKKRERRGGKGRK